jgi:hypothetical protein
MTLAELRAVYGNLVRDMSAFSNRGTLLTVSKRPRNRIGLTGRENVSRNAHMNFKRSFFSSFSLALSSTRHCHFWNVFHAVCDVRNGY